MSDDVRFERLEHPRAADLTAVVSLESASFRNPWSAEALAQMLESDVARLYVAKTGDTIVAFCACWLIAGDLHINTIAVEVGLRRRQIATRLLQFVLDTTGAGRATLEVRRSNVAALKLYENMAFKVTGVRPRYYDNPSEDALILWLNP